MIEDFHPNVRRGKEFISKILKAVIEGKLKEPFTPIDIQKAVLGYSPSTYKLFPWKHCLQNPKRKTTALFYYVGETPPKPRDPPYEKRKYRLLRSSDTVDR